MTLGAFLKNSSRIAAKVILAICAAVGALTLSVVFLLITLVVVLAKELPESRHEPSVSEVIKQAGGKDKIAIIPIVGTISAGESSSPLEAQGVSAQETIRLLRHADQDSAVKAVIIRMNTPGGAVVASDEIYQMVKTLRTHKPVIVSMADQAASGGYYIASGATKIVANNATLTGSIGVIAHLPKFSKLYDKLGVEMRTFKSGAFKDIGSADRDVTPEEKQILDTMISEAYDQFVQAIATGRHMDDDKVRSLADGRIYTGKQALELGLVDALGNLQDAISIAEDEAHVSDPTVVEYSGQSFIQSLISGSLSSLLAPLAQFGPLMSANQKFGVYYLMD